MRERKDVYQLPAGDKTLEWYSKAVAAMKKRPTTDPTSWYYQAAIHGFNPALPQWRDAPPLPSPSEQSTFWRQCQHGSWYFLPWHRMYLAYFEQIVAQTVADLGGPKDWALPFWNYSDTSNPKARIIPAPFTDPNNATNALWIEGRQSNTIPAQYVVLDALNTVPYTGNGITAPLGFGGPETAFSHSGGTHGKLESLPHDMVHVAIGGSMGDPRTAALDPIFWLHHANIDRLWQVWLNKKGGRMNPTEKAWLNFKFDFHDKNGKPVEFKSSQVEDTTKVLTGYTYQGVDPGVIALKSTARLKENVFSAPLEVVAATNSRQILGNTKTIVPLSLNPSKRKRAQFMALAEAVATPKTTVLHFENVTGTGIPPIHDVYINAPKETNDPKQYYAGSLSFFGIEEASTPSEHHSGSGQHYALDISDLINKLRSESNWNESEMDISMEPSRSMESGASVSIGRISVYSA